MSIKYSRYFRLCMYENKKNQIPHTIKDNKCTKEKKNIYLADFIILKQFNNLKDFSIQFQRML